MRQIWCKPDNRHLNFFIDTELMKKFLIAASLLFASKFTHAQYISDSYRPLTNDQHSLDFLQYRNRFNVKIGTGISVNYRNHENFLKGGALSISAEPSYRLTNFIAVGVRGEYAFTRYYYSEIGRVKADPIGSISLTGDIIKLFKHKYAPFFGIGAGAYLLGTGRFPAAINPTGENPPVQTENLGTRFGVSSRIGVNLGQFSIAVEMHLIDEKTFYNRDYATLKLGYSL